MRGSFLGKTLKQRVQLAEVLPRKRTTHALLMLLPVESLWQAPFTHLISPHRGEDLRRELMSWRDRKRGGGVLARLGRPAEPQLAIRQMRERVSVAWIETRGLAQLARRIVKAAEEQQVESVLLARAGEARAHLRRAPEERLGDVEGFDLG